MRTKPVFLCLAILCSSATAPAEAWATPRLFPTIGRRLSSGRPRSLGLRHSRAARNPLFLRDLERANNRALPRGSKVQRVFRGFAMEDYGAKEVVGYLFGEWRHALTSHTFSKKLKARLAENTPFSSALRKTAREVSREAREEIRREGYLKLDERGALASGYLVNQSRATWWGFATDKKQATGMAADPRPLLDGRAWGPFTAFGYAATAYSSIVSQKVVMPWTAKLVVEAKQAVPAGVTDEVHMISHVAPTQIERVFVGHSNWYDVRMHHLPPNEKTKWYALTINQRDALGRPSDVSISETRVGGRVQLGPELWNSRKAAPESDQRLCEAHPAIAPALRELRKQLALAPPGRRK